MIEIITTILGLIQGLLVWANKRINWIFYCLQYVFLGIFSFHAHLYGDVMSSVVYFGIGIAGWLSWNRNRGNLPVRVCSKNERIIYLALITFATIVFSVFLNSTSDPLPVLDAITTTTSFAATCLMASKKIDTWILWLLNDILYICEYWLLPDQAVYLILLNTVWAGMAVGSLITWRRIYREEHRKESAV